MAHLKEGDMAVQIAFNTFRSQERVSRMKYIKKARSGKQAVEKRERKKRTISDTSVDADSG